MAEEEACRTEVVVAEEEAGRPEVPPHVIAADEEVGWLKATALRRTPRLPSPRSLRSVVAVVAVPSAAFAVVQAKPDASTTAQNAGETSRNSQSG